MDIVVLDMPILDTRSSLTQEDLTKTFVADLVLQILSYVAEKSGRISEDDKLKRIAAAKARGVKFGNPVSPFLKTLLKLLLAGGRKKYR